MVGRGWEGRRGGTRKGRGRGRKGEGRDGREREKGSERIGKGREGKENGDRPPTIFGLKVALGTRLRRQTRMTTNFKIPFF